jgi:predicted metal-dependent enzyme (double-stranded beta helix superfamily)
MTICVLGAASGYLIINSYEKISGNNYKPDTLLLQESTLSAEAGMPVYYNYTPGPSVLYTVAEHNGHIGIYDGTRTELIELLDVDVSSLPESDRMYLENGIKIYSIAELMTVICDYTG